MLNSLDLASRARISSQLGFDPKCSWDKNGHILSLLNLCLCESTNLTNPAQIQVTALVFDNTYYAVNTDDKPELNDAVCQLGCVRTK